MKFTKLLCAAAAAVCLIIPSVSNALEKGDKILIAYFSHTNNTERLAEDLVKGLTDYDVTLTKIVSVDPYAEDMEKMSPRVKDEQENNTLIPIALSNYVPNLKDFDAVLVGTPIWFNHAPVPIKSFLNAYPVEQEQKLAVFITSGTSEPDVILSDIEKYSTHKVDAYMQYRPGHESGMVRGERYSIFIDDINAL